MTTLGNLLDKMAVSSNNYWEQEKKIHQWEETTPYILLKSFKTAYVRAIRIGALNYWPNWLNRGEDMFGEYSTVYHFSLSKPFAKIPKDNTFEKEINKIDEEIKSLREQRQRLIDKEWKRATKPLWKEDLIPIVERKKKELA